MGSIEDQLFTSSYAVDLIDHLSPHQEISSVFYLSPIPLYRKEKPFFLNVPVHRMQGARQTNVTHTVKIIKITDIRGSEDKFTLDTAGFQVGELETHLQYSDFGEEESITTKYFPEVRDFLREQTGAREVLPWDYQVRRQDDSLPQNSRGLPGRAQPFGAVHADQTGLAAERRLRERYQIVNVWKPLRGPVESRPLAMCDYRSVQREDEVATDIVFPDYLGETFNFYPGQSHRWYYLDKQKSSEALMIKCFDSATQEDPGIAQYAPHVSFPLRNQKEDAQPRESIEVRCYVFY